MAHSQPQSLLTPPASIASPTPSTVSLSGLASNLPMPRSKRLQPGSQKEIALINYLDARILKITRRYAKKFSNEGLENDDTPGYTTYDEFVADADPLVDLAWVSGTPTIQIPYLLSLAGLASSYLQAFPFSTFMFPLTSKIDQGFAALLRPSETESTSNTQTYHVSMTEKVRIKSLIDETRIAAVNAATSSGHIAGAPEVSETEDEDDDEPSEVEDDDDDPQSMSIYMALSKTYKKTLEILGDSLVVNSPPPPEDDDLPMT